MKQGSLKVARRYAKALISLCDERGDGEAVRAHLLAVCAALDAVPEAHALVANPTIPLDQRRAVLTAVMGACGVAGTAVNLLQLLLDKGRIQVLPAISAEFSALLDLRSGRTEAQVTSAVALSEDAKTRLQGLLVRLLGKQVVLQASVDDQLIGGLVVRVGNTVYDASVANHLARLRQALVSD